MGPHRDVDIVSLESVHSHVPNEQCHCVLPAVKCEQSWALYPPKLAEVRPFKFYTIELE